LRYAVHKLIVAAERQDQVKSAKDIMQASTLIEALATRRPLELAKAWTAAWENGPRWREKLEAGRARLDQAREDLLAQLLVKAAASRNRIKKG
jgi:hypothetical protein